MIIYFRAHKIITCYILPTEITLCNTKGLESYLHSVKDLIRLQPSSQYQYIASKESKTAFLDY